MKRSLLLALLAAALSGCIMEGDSVVNATDQTIRIIVVTDRGAQFEEKIKPHSTIGERRKSLHDTGPRYQRLQAFDATGREIGHFDIDQISGHSKTYGKFSALLVTTNGVFPIPDRYSYQPAQHIPEIEQIFYHESQAQPSN